MNKHSGVYIFPAAAALTYWISDSVLTTIFYPNDVMPRCVSVLAILLVGTAATRLYLRLRSEAGQLRPVVERLTTENTRSIEKIEELEAKSAAAIAESDDLRKQLIRAEDKLDVLGLIVVIVNAEGVVSFINRKGCHILGYGRADIVGRRFFENFVPESVRAFAQSEAKKLLAGGSTAEKEYTGLLVDRNGTERVVEWHHTVLKGADGRAVSIMSAGADVTGRTEAAAKGLRLRERLSRSRRMEALAAFAVGVAGHLADILNWARNAPDVVSKQSSAQTDDGGTSSRNSPETEVQRGQALGVVLKDVDMLVGDLVNVGAGAKVDTTELDLNAVVRSCLSSRIISVLGDAHPSVLIKTALAGDLLPVTGSEPLLIRALTGMITRAFDALPDGGEVVITTKNLHVRESLEKYETIPEGDYAVVWVADGGEVLGEAQLDRIFEPYAECGQSKACEFGLALTYGIAKSHKGYVNAKSEAGLGTEIALCFPVVGTKAGTAQKKTSFAQGTESILIVDDSEQQRTMAGQFLGMLGYKVAIAASGLDALGIFQAVGTGKSPCDLVLLDMVMGDDLDGLDTYREIVKQFPGQKCVIMTGYTDAERAQEAARLGAGQFLSKPYTLERLAKTVRDELDRKS